MNSSSPNNNEDQTKANTGTNKQRPGWQDFVSFEARPHAEPISGPVLVKRATNLMKRFTSDANSTTSDRCYTREQCEDMAYHMLNSPNDVLPIQCRQYEDVIPALKRYNS